MTSTQILARAALALALFPFVGLAFAFLARRSQRRWGSAGLVAAWIVSSFAVTLLTVARIRQQQAALGFAPAQMQRASLVAAFLPFWTVTFGAVAFRLRNSRYTTIPTFNWTVARGTLGAFLTGTLAFLIGLALFDFASVLRQP